jgi:hypothetical protein
MALAVADFMADGQVLGVAVAAFAQGLDVLQRGGLWRDMLSADPAGHDAMQLACHGSVHLDAEVSQTAHAGDFAAKHAPSGSMRGEAVAQLAFGLPEAAGMPTIAPLPNIKGLP